MHVQVPGEVASMREGGGSAKSGTSCLPFLSQGWGNVGAAAGFYLAQMGVRVVAIIDRDNGVMKPEGFTLDEVTQMLISRNGMLLNCPNMVPYDEIMDKAWDIGADIFVPCAASRIVEQQHVERLMAKGLEVCLPLTLLLAVQKVQVLGVTRWFRDRAARAGIRVPAQASAWHIGGVSAVSAPSARPFEGTGLGPSPQ